VKKFKQKYKKRHRATRTAGPSFNPLAQFLGAIPTVAPWFQVNGLRARLERIQALAHGEEPRAKDRIAALAAEALGILDAKTVGELAQGLQSAPDHEEKT
jgi:hypothetical protein